MVSALLAACQDAAAPANTATQKSAPAGAETRPPEGLVAQGAVWEKVADGYVYTDAPVGDPDGNVYYAEPIINQLFKVDDSGGITQLDTNTEHTMGLVMGPDGLIYACRNRGAQIVRYSLDGTYEVLYQGEVTPLPNKPDAPGEFCNDLAINADGGIWITDRVNREILYLDPDGDLRAVAGGFRGNGIVLSADRKMIVVTNSNEPRLHAFAVGENGALTELEDFFDPIVTIAKLGEQDIASKRAGTNGMTVDTDGRFYVSSFYGVQVFGPDGRYVGVINRPPPFTSNLGFAGQNRDWLYASGRVALYRLKMQVQGVAW